MPEHSLADTIQQLWEERCASVDLDVLQAAVEISGLINLATFADLVFDQVKEYVSHLENRYCHEDAEAGGINTANIVSECAGVIELLATIKAIQGWQAALEAEFSDVEEVL